MDTVQHLVVVDRSDLDNCIHTVVVLDVLMDETPIISLDQNEHG
jgi:hypothetical protein